MRALYGEKCYKNTYDYILNKGIIILLKKIRVINKNKCTIKIFLSHHMSIS